MFQLSHEALDIVILNGRLKNNLAGSYVVFEGRVRGEHKGQLVTSLEYEAYEPLAQKEFSKIKAEMTRKFDLIDIACVHRLGMVKPGEVGVWAAVLSGHRKDGFEACAYLMSHLKKRLPIWKKENYESGKSRWVADCQGCI